MDAHLSRKCDELLQRHAEALFNRTRAEALAMAERERRLGRIDLQLERGVKKEDLMAGRTVNAQYRAGNESHL
jgi:hypothetical protein